MSSAQNPDLSAFGRVKTFKGDRLKRRTEKLWLLWLPQIAQFLSFQGYVFSVSGEQPR